MGALCRGIPTNSCRGRRRRRGSEGAVLHTLLLVFAFVLFVVAAFSPPTRINLVAAGLACWVATLIF